jgi:hypothetical protein
MSEKSTKIDEQKTAKANLFLNFFNEVQNLKHEEAIYHNLLIELNARYSNLEDLSKIPDSDKNIIIQQTQKVRYYALVSYRSYKSLSTQIKTNQEKKPDDFINCIKEPDKNMPLLIDRDILGNYVVSLLTFLADDIVKQLLDSSQELVDKVY